MTYATLTLATLRARLQDRFTGDPFWSNTEANDALNEALRQFNLYTGYWRGNGTTNTTATVAFVTVPGSLTYHTRVTRSGFVLARKSLVELYRTRRNWRTQSTTTGSPVPSTIREWAPVGLGSIAIWPTDTAGGTTLTFEAVKITPILTADGQFLDVGNEELNLILSEALWILTFKRPSLLAQMKPKHQVFLDGCLERNDQLRASSYYRRVLGLDQTQRIVPRLLPKDEELTA